MINLVERSAEADGQLNKFVTKADGKAEDAYIYEADLVFTITTVDQAKVVEKVIPGAVEVFARAQREDDNWKFNTTVNPDIVGVKAILSHASRGKVAMQGGCEIKSVRLRSSKKATACTVKVVFGGQTAQGAANLAAMLTETCSLSMEQQQTVIPFPNAGPAAPPPGKGDIIIAWDSEVGETYCGRFVEQEGNRVTLEDFDSEYVVDVDAITGVLKVTGDVTALRRSFKSRCKKRDIKPSWASIVLAFAEGSEVKGTATLALDSSIIEKAVTRLESGDAEFLPPEAGSSEAARA